MNMAVGTSNSQLEQTFQFHGGHQEAPEAVDSSH